MQRYGTPTKPGQKTLGKKNQGQKASRRRAAQRGMAVAMSMLFLLGLLTLMLVGITGTSSGSLGTGTASTAGNALQLTSARSQSVTASELAASGVELTLQWLHSQTTPPAQTAAFAPALWGASLIGNPQRAVVNFPNSTDSSHTFSILIYPDSGNATASQKKYLIEAIGTSGTVTQIVRAYVEQGSFANFGYFSDNSAPNSYWTSGLSSFDGPVHCNNSNGVMTNIVWKPGTTTPIFNDTAADAVTISGSPIHWFLNTPMTSVGPQSVSDYGSIAAGGQASVHMGSPVIPFPTSSTLQQQTALAGQSAPTLIGVFVPSSGGSTVLGVLTGSTATGGIYIHGEIAQMTLALGTAGIQAITVQQTDENGHPLTSLITLNPQLGQTIVAVTRIVGVLPVITVTTYSGATNGVVYCDGNIGSQTAPKSGGLYGIIADNQVSNLGGILGQSRLTIATAASKNINIDGSLTYNTARQLNVTGLPISETLDTVFLQKAGTLGLISNNIEVVDNNVVGVPLTHVEVDAAALAFNTFDATDPDTRPAGQFISMGSFLVGNESEFGRLNGVAGLQTGLSTQRVYDGRLAVNPPPVFPVTASSYQIISWSVLPATLQ